MAASTQAVPAITAASCLFPSGPGMALAQSALLTNQALNRRHPFYIDRSGEPVRVSCFAQPPTFDHARWVEMAMAVLTELHEQTRVAGGGQGKPGPTALWMVVPPVGRPGVPAKLAEHIWSACKGGPFAWTSVQVVQGGHAAPIVAIQLAAALLGSAPRGPAQATAAVVLAVDSWMHADALRWLEEHDLLHHAGRPVRGGLYRNPHGRIPGEAAAAVMLSAKDKGWCNVLGTGLADESILRTAPRPCTGQGWTQAARQALAGLALVHKITHVFSDLNGEPYRADQFGFTCMRLNDRLQDGWERHTPALVSGDVGTATALVHVALSAQILRRHLGTSPQSHLLLASSDDSLRSALVLGH